jgi:hypothetical protein
MEGILHLQRKSDAVHVLVDGWPVNALSVEVIEVGVVPVDSFDNGDKREYKKQGGSNWRPVHDLDRALADGSVHWRCAREIRKPTFVEDTWEDASKAVGPLLAAGWSLKEESTCNDEGQFSATETLERNDQVVEIECFEGGGIHVYAYTSDYDPETTGYCSEPSSESGDLEELRKMFAEQGWLQ